MTYTQLASWLAVECAVLIFLASAAIWFIKFALSASPTTIADAYRATLAALPA